MFFFSIVPCVGIKLAHLNRHTHFILAFNNRYNAFYARVLTSTMENSTNACVVSFCLFFFSLHFEANENALRVHSLKQEAPRPSYTKVENNYDCFIRIKRNWSVCAQNVEKRSELHTKWSNEQKLT